MNSEHDQRMKWQERERQIRASETAEQTQASQARAVQGTEKTRLHKL